MELKMSTSQQIIQAEIQQKMTDYLAFKRSQLARLNASTEEWEQKACGCPESRGDIINALEALMVLTRWKGQVRQQCKAAEQLQQKLAVSAESEKLPIKGGDTA